MKIALYIEDGLEQIVLTPETDTEKAILGKLSDGSRDLQIHHGSFYECRGGWVRHKGSYTSIYDRERHDDSSTMIVLREKPVGAEGASPSDGALGRQDGSEGEAGTLRDAIPTQPPKGGE